MQVDALEIPDLKLITPVKHSDERGFFSEIYSQRDMEAAGLNPSFLQENCSFSAQKHTVRGLHWQSPPAAQAKINSCNTGCNSRCCRGHQAEFAMVWPPHCRRAVSGQLAAASGASRFRPRLLHSGREHHCLI